MSTQTVTLNTQVKCLDGVTRWRKVRGRRLADGTVQLPNDYRISPAKQAADRAASDRRC